MSAVSKKSKLRQMRPAFLRRIDDMAPTTGLSLFKIIRRSFCDELAAELSWHRFAVECPRSPVGVFWRDSQDTLNRATLIPYSQPTDWRRSPWIARVVFNFGCVRCPGTIRRRLSTTAGHAPEWRLELSLLPREVDWNLARWLASWINAKDEGAEPNGKAPHRIKCPTAENYTWSPAAAQVYDEHCRRLNEWRRAAANARAEGSARTGAQQ